MFVNPRDPGRKLQAPACLGRSLAAAALTFASFACAADQLAGRIWSPDRQAFVEPARVARAVADADYVLLGETHTSPRHHLLQARLLDAASDQRSPALVLEMVDGDQQATIAEWRSAGAQPEDFGPAVRWAERGWPDWSIYQPIVEIAASRDLPIRAGGPAQTPFARVAQEGLAALDSERRRELRLEQPLPNAARQRLAGILRRSHCGELHVPIERMIALQRLRDAVMAQRMRTAVGDGAVLIAGRGHTRRDFGVPAYLEPADGETVTVALRGTRAGTDLAALRGSASEVMAHDYVWFTADEPPDMPCPDGHAATETGGSSRGAKDGVN